MDTINKICGDFGVWQLRTILIIFLCKIPSSWFMACIIFTAPEPTNTEYFCNQTSDLKCFYKNSNDNQISHPCTEFIYFADFYSLVMQFDLVCDRSIFVAWSQYWHLFGVLLGGIIATTMMMFISPKKVMLIGIITQIIFGCLTGYINNFTINCLLRCLCAICCALMFTSGQTIFSEITGGNFKIGAIILYDTFWSIGVILLSTLSIYFSSWNHIYLSISLPTLSMVILYFWIPEAPRWLLKRGRIVEIEKILLNAAEINDRKHFLTDNLLKDLQNDAIEIKKQNDISIFSGWFELWKGPKAKSNFIAAHVALAIYVTNFNGMLLNIRSFGRDFLSLNSIITAFSEIIGCFLALYITMNFNKLKWTIAGSFNIIAGVIGCFGWFFPEYLDKITQNSLWMLISSIPKAGVSISQSMLLACLPELVAPSKRPAFMFSCIVWARIWLLTAPFINVLKRIDTALSLSFFCVLGLIGGIATCNLKKYPNEQLTSHKSESIEGIINLAHQ